MISLDTNIIARHLLNDIPDHSGRAKCLFEIADDGEVELFVPASVFVELCHLFHRTLSMSRDDVASTLLGVLRLTGLHIENGDAIRSALEFWAYTGGLLFLDCYHLALTRERGMKQIYSFARKMSRFPGVERIEPGKA